MLVASISDTCNCVNI